MKSNFEPKDLSKVSSIQHGKHNEVIARSLYARKVQKQMHKNFTVYDCGLVVQIPPTPTLEPALMAKYLIPLQPAHLDYLKSSAHTSGQNNSMEEACQDPNFPD